MEPRGRYAPSPTGNMTVANAYTALRAWLDVKSRGGEFVLRIDDTDPERNVVTVDSIVSDLTSLGITWDEGPDVGGPYAPYVVSRRLERHVEAARSLEASGRAYWDYTPPLEDASAHKKTKGADRGRTGAYRGNPEPVSGVEPVLRLRVPDARVEVHDRVFGEISQAADDIGEVALLRSDGTPTYHLASCVDDIDMRITSVVRGADWLNSLPQHWLILEALGADPMPEFAHLPLLVGKDGQKLSKREGGLAIRHLVAEEGVPPLALDAYLANLGFPERPDLLSLTELASDFDIAAHNRNSPRFDPKKLRSFTRRWLAEKEAEDSFVAEIRDRAPAVGEDTVRLLLPGVRPRVGTYQEAADLYAFLLASDEAGRDVTPISDEVAARIIGTEPWSAAQLEAAVDSAVPTDAEQRKAMMKAFRDALAPGFRVTPPIHYLLLGLGRERSRIRLGVRTEAAG
ncbi:MAG: hypothetical protein IT198_01005 [Acidimicrobiia bacterium]|nr:hypothetical protein [Acidimicrobiia bacterium]